MLMMMVELKDREGDGVGRMRSCGFSAGLSSEGDEDICTCV